MSNHQQSDAKPPTAWPTGAAHLPETSRKNLSLASVRHAFRTIIWPRRKLVLLGLLLVAINRLAGLVLPGSTKYLIDNVIGESRPELLRNLLIVVGAAILVQATTSFLLTLALTVTSIS